MSRLYDRVMSCCKPSGSDIKMPFLYIGNATVVNADDVVRYWLSHPKGERIDLFRDLLTTVPPFETMFVEANFPGGVELNEFNRDLGSTTVQRLYSWGVLMHSYIWSDDDEANRDYLKYIGREGLWKYRSKLGWVSRMWVFVEPSKKMTYGPVFYYDVPMQRDGSGFETDEEPNAKPEFIRDTQQETIDKEHEKLRSASSSEQELLLRLKRKMKEIYFARELALIGIDALFPLLLSTAFMHCKNIELEPVNPPEKASKKHERKYGKPLTRYYTLDINPMKSVLKYEGGIENNGLRKALHICRGHFRTYTDKGPGGRKLDAPMTLWIPEHQRGSEDRGRIVKDYKVKAPV